MRVSFPQIAQTPLYICSSLYFSFCFQITLHRYCSFYVCLVCLPAHLSPDKYQFSPCFGMSVIERTVAQFCPPQFWRSGNFGHATLPVSFGWHSKRRRSFPLYVYAMEVKYPARENGKTCCWFTKLEKPPPPLS